MSLYDVNPNEHITRLAEKLKEEREIKAPVWAAFVKTGHFKQRQPVSKDWWHIRSAAVLRSIARLGPVGTSKLRTKYGGKKNRGVKAEHSYKGSGSIIRKILQQLEKAGLVKQAQKGVHKGRVITPKGQSLIDKTSLEIYRPVKKEKAQKQEKPSEKQAVKKPRKAAEKTPKKEEKAE